MRDEEMQKSKCKMQNEKKELLYFCILHFAFITFFTSSLIAAALIPSERDADGLHDFA